MRLWHEDLIPLLDRQRILGQHRELCALRGKGWGKKHATVNYVFTHPIEKLIAFHVRVIYEMYKRGYKVADEWTNLQYRGKLLGIDDNINEDVVMEYYCQNTLIYKEHDDNYLKECLENLKGKGVNIDI